MEMARNNRYHSPIMPDFPGYRNRNPYAALSLNIFSLGGMGREYPWMRICIVEGDVFICEKPGIG